jgi:membrane protease YdiL (CAAX protease family)
VSAVRRLGRWLWAPVAPAFEGVDVGSAVIVIVAAAALLASRYHGEVGDFRRIVGTHLARLPGQPILPYLYWFATSAVLYGLVPLVTVRLLPGERLRDFGVGLGGWRLGLSIAAVFYAVMLPLVLLVSHTRAFEHTYPLCQGALGSWGLFAVYEVGYVLYFVAWEWLFRGFLLFGMYERIGGHAIWVTLIPFALMHVGKPEAEAFGAIIAAVALAVLALRTRSFWWGALLHASVAFTMDLVIALRRIH